MMPSCPHCDTPVEQIYAVHIDWEHKDVTLGTACHNKHCPRYNAQEGCYAFEVTVADEGAVLAKVGLVRRGDVGALEPKLATEAFDAFGFEGQIKALGEEAAELAAACFRLLNGKGDVWQVAEEAIGVSSVLSSVRPHLVKPIEWACIREGQQRKLDSKLKHKRSMEQEQGEDQ